VWFELSDSLTLRVNINIIGPKSSTKFESFFHSEISSSFVLFAIYLLYETSLISLRKELGAHLNAAAAIGFVRQKRLKR
jgi:hypothetical protein